jgi:hypothetical protein
MSRATTTTSKATYQVTPPGSGLKSFQSATDVQRWAEANRGIGIVTVWGWCASLDAYLFLQSVHL